MFDNDNFDLEFESNMVQSRLLSPIIDEIDNKELTQEDLSELTGLPQSFLSCLFSNKKKLSISHIARFQKALEVVMQPPKLLSQDEHQRKFYDGENKGKMISINSQLFPTEKYSNIDKQMNSNSLELINEFEL